MWLEFVRRERMESTVRVCKEGMTQSFQLVKKYTQNVESGTSIQDIESQKGKKGEPPKRSARVSSGPFNSQTDCLFCGTTVTPGGAGFSYVKTDTFVKTILECCDSRSDEWVFTVKGRIEYYCCDLHAADCIYHHSCSGNFQSGASHTTTVPQCPRGKAQKVWPAQKRRSGAGIHERLLLP